MVSAMTSDVKLRQECTAVNTSPAILATRADLSALALIAALDMAALRPPNEVTASFLAIFDSMPGKIERPEPLEDIWVIARRDFTQIRDELMAELPPEMSTATISSDERGARQVF